MTERATITNMGAELGATSSIFPADERVKEFMISQQRGDQYVEMLPDPDAQYDGEIDIDLSALEPLCACPHQPDNVIPLREVEKKKVQQVFIGSCTNASYSDIAKIALIRQHLYKYKGEYYGNERQVLSQSVEKGLAEFAAAAANKV